MILVIGATGKLGASAVKELAAAGAAVRAMSRYPTKLPILSDNVEAIQGDLEIPETISFALKGVRQVLLAAATNNLPVHEVNVIHQAEDAGVEHLVLVSSLGIDYGVASGPAHRAGEEALRSSGLSWAILRGSAFMSNALRWADSIRSSGEFYEPTGDGTHAMIDPADIGAVAARLLLSPEHENQTLQLTGPEALTSAEYAEKLATVLAMPVRHVDIPAQAYRDAMLGAGVPSGVLEPVARFYELVKAGRLSMVTKEVERVVGRPARTFSGWAQVHAAAFR